MDRYALLVSAVTGFAVGDALGAPAEFGERWMRDMDPVRGMRPGGIFDVPPGGWTDDTAMTLAALHSLARGFDPGDMMDRFLMWLNKGEYSWSGEAIGIGKQILRALEHYQAYGDVRTCGRDGEQDNGNGSLMRILPVCLYGLMRMRDGLPPDGAIGMIEATSALTHSHPRSIAACILYFFIVRAAAEEEGSLKERVQSGLAKGFEYLRGVPRYERELSHYARLAPPVPIASEPRDRISSSGYVVDTLEAAVWCLLTTEDYPSCVLQAVNLGLDTDTVAAIAGGIAGLYYGTGGIPAEWIEALQKREMIEEACCALFCSLSV